MNRRQALTTLLVTGAAGGLGVAAASPAVAGPKKGAHRTALFTGTVEFNGWVSSQALIGYFEGVNTEIAFWGVRLNNYRSHPLRVQYKHLRTIERFSGSRSIRDEDRTWRLAALEDRTIWFGGFELAGGYLAGEGSVKYGNLGWGPATHVATKAR
jgi:hypothetical protein